jgi:hypothetical protein
MDSSLLFLFHSCALEVGRVYVEKRKGGGGGVYTGHLVHGNKIKKVHWCVQSKACVNSFSSPLLRPLQHCQLCPSYL